MATNQNEYNQALQNLILMNRKKIEIEKVWENASPSSLFNAQSITIQNLQNYDYILMTGAYSTGSYRNSLILSLTAIGDKSSFCIAANIIATRHITIESNKITFGAGYQVNTYGGSSMIANDVCIPREIYLLKG